MEKLFGIFVIKLRDFFDICINTCFFFVTLLVPLGKVIVLSHVLEPQEDNILLKYKILLEFHFYFSLELLEYFSKTLKGS